jgi:hypothetical protein
MRNSNMSNSSNYLINFLSMVKGLGFEGVSERKYVLGDWSSPDATLVA